MGTSKMPAATGKKLMAAIAIYVFATKSSLS